MIGWVIFSLLAFCRLVSGASLNGTLEDREWKNEYDQPLSFECDPGEHLVRWKSQYSSNKEDRQWDFECRPGLASKSCYWLNDGNYVNQYDRMIMIDCNDLDRGEVESVLAGVSSIHNNHKGDRIWKFKCCKVNAGSQPKKNCKWSRPIPSQDGKNVAWTKPMDFPVPVGKGIFGINSAHQGRIGPINIEDRFWQFYLCEYSVCTATSMKILSNDFVPKPIGSSVVAIGTIPVCTEGSKGTLTISRTRGMSESIGVTTSTSSSFAIGASLTIEKTVGVSLKAFESSMTLGFTASTEFTQSWGKDETTDETDYTEDAVEGSIEIFGIKGGYLTGLVDEYKFEKSAIPVEYKYRCTTTTPDIYTYHTAESTINLRAHVYGHVHFDNHQEAWSSQEECEENKACLRSLNAKLALSPSQLLAEFKKCFPGST